MLAGYSWKGLLDTAGKTGWIQLEGLDEYNWKVWLDTARSVSLVQLDVLVEYG